MPCLGWQEGAEPLVAYGARETIKMSRPVISFEQRRDKPVTQEMIAALDVPDHVSKFDLVAYCVNSLNYTVYSSPDAGRGDLMLIPAEVAPTRHHRIRPQSEQLSMTAASAAPHGL